MENEVMNDVMVEDETADAVNTIIYNLNPNPQEEEKDYTTEVLGAALALGFAVGYVTKKYVAPKAAKTLKKFKKWVAEKQTEEKSEVKVEVETEN